MAKAKKATAKEPVVPKTKNDKFEAQLISLGLGDALVLAEKLVGMDVECMTTGFPELDLAISEQLVAEGNGGLPRGRHSEVFSRKESSGKTSLLLKIAAVLQSLGFRVGIADIEQTITTAYMTLNGIKTKASECGDNLYPVRLLRSQFDFNDDDTPEKNDLYCDDVLGIIKKAMNVFDFLIVDSVDAMASKDDALKESEDNRQVGGISKKLSAFFRENRNFRSHVAWINQTRQAVGAYSPSGSVTYVTTGGRALPFYATLRFELADIATLKDGKDDDQGYGFIMRVKIIKNKIGNKGRYVDLYYINGEGVSVPYSYFNQAVKVGAIWTSGAWHYFGSKKGDKDGATYRAQGQLNMYRKMKAEPEFYAQVKTIIDGEDVELNEEEVNELALAASEDLAAEEKEALPAAA